MKEKATKMHFLVLKLSKPEIFLQKQDFYVLDERNKQNWQPLITQMGRAMKKIVLKRGEAWLKQGNFTQSYICLFLERKTRLAQSRSS